MSSETQPSRALLIAAGALTQLIGLICLVLAIVSIPVIADERGSIGSIVVPLVASLAAMVCGSLVWRGRLVPLALAAGLDIGFGIGVPRGGSAVGTMLRILAADDAQTAESLILALAIMMFAAAIVCVLAVPSALRLREWVRDQTASQTVPTQVLPMGELRRGKATLIVGVSITVIALAVVVTTTVTRSKLNVTTTSNGSATVKLSPHAAVVDASVAMATGSAMGVMGAALDAAPGERIGVDAFLARFHDALSTHDDLGPLFDAGAFAFGVEANDLAEGRDAIVAQLRHDIGDVEPPAIVSVKFTHIGQEGDVAWAAEELRVGPKTFVASAVLGLRDGAWTIAALHWAAALPNASAYRLAREGNLPPPDAIPSTSDPSPLAVAMRRAFASKPSFVNARSTRSDAFNFGSAGERLAGGATIRKIFGRIKATIVLHDAVKVGSVGARGGWGVANVDFTDADKDGTEVTQTFRVLVGWIEEDAGWRMVLTQWSNAT